MSTEPQAITCCKIRTTAIDRGKHQFNLKSIVGSPNDVILEETKREGHLSTACSGYRCLLDQAWR